MLVQVYGRWIDRGPRKLERIWERMQNMPKFAPKHSRTNYK